MHRYFLKSPLISAAEAVPLIQRIELNGRNLSAMGPDILGSISDRTKKTRTEFEKILQRLHGAVSQHWPDKMTARPKKIDPGIVKKIHISIFGFSRGATQARAFASWLTELCRLDASLCGKSGTLTLGGFEIEVDFLGLFDTVASVGLGSTFSDSRAGKRFHGHDAWADSELSLRIPEGVRCVHLVAAHEVRRSFPLDSIAVGQTTPVNCEEVVFPGVHSDIGSGYSPREQGRGLDPDGDDMLTRIPLLCMYKKARIAGVPFKLEYASEVAKRRFQIAPATITALNEYLGAASVKAGPLTAIMREQAKFHIQWRLARRAGSNASLESSGSFQRASTFEQNDLHSANLEFEKEIAAFETWLAGKGKGFAPTAQHAGFGSEHEHEWEEIATWWGKGPPPSQSVLRFFDNYVHDSRAWFKLIPGNPDNEEDARAQLKEWLAKRQSERERNAREEKMFLENQRTSFQLVGRKHDASAPKYVPRKNELTDAQRDAADEYARTKKIPRMITEGREPFEMGPVAGKAGYLRFRRVYAGGDSRLISKYESTEPDSARAA